MVDQLTTLLAATRFERPLDRQPTDVGALLAAAADDVRPFIDIRGQTLTVETPVDLGSLPVEAAKIRDCLQHVLLNAIKFTPDGGHIALELASRAYVLEAGLLVADGSAAELASSPAVVAAYLGGAA